MMPDVLNSPIRRGSINLLFYSNKERLQHSIIIIALFNLFLASVLGLLLRAYPLFPVSFPTYKNLLHAHSHFAFGGWIMPVLLALILKYFPDIANRISYTHLKNINLLMLVSAYGMLISFPFQGYAFASISFSTLSILAGFYMAYVFWRASDEFKSQVSVSFLRAGLVYLTFS